MLPTPVTLPVAVSPIVPTVLPNSTVIAPESGNTISLDELVALYNKYAVLGNINNTENRPPIESYSVNTDGTVNFAYSDGRSFSNFDPNDFHAIVSSFVNAQENM